MKGSRALFLAAVLAAACVGLCFGQEVSEKKDLAVFALSTYDATVPGSVMGGVDAAIQEVFIGLGRFNVLGMTYRLGKGDVAQFIAKIKELKEQNIEIPEKVQMGQEFFTEADLNAILGAFIVVIPTVTFYNVEGSSTTSTTTSTSTTTKAVGKSTIASLSTRTTTTDTTGDYHAALKASFTFVDIEKMTAIAQADVECDGYDDDPEVAGQEAVEDIPSQLTYEIRKIEEFKLKTGVLEVDGRKVIIELGRDLGIQVGDEFEILGSRVLSSGKTLSTRTGLLVIREVSDEVSIAQIIYAKPRPEIGDQLKEFPLFGMTVLPYAQLVLSGLIGGTEVTPVVLLGGRAVWNRGLFRFKPNAGLEIPLNAPGLGFGSGWLPVNLYVGGEMDLYLGRLQVNPMVSAGVGGAVPLQGEGFSLSHVGFKTLVNLTYLVADKVKISADAGFTYWFGLSGWADYDYFGPLLGAGAEIKL